MAHRVKVEEIRSRLNFQSCFAVDCIGRSGGLCVLWKEQDACNVLSYSQNHIDLQVNDVDCVWRAIGEILVIYFGD